MMANDLPDLLTRAADRLRQVAQLQRDLAQARAEAALYRAALEVVRENDPPVTVSWLYRQGVTPGSNAEYKGVQHVADIALRGGGA